MARFTASLGTSARILLHPNAAAAPVVQQRRAGRLPKSITNLARFASQKSCAQYMARSHVQQEHLDTQRDLISTTETMLASFRFDLARMKQLSSTTPGAM